MIASETSEAQIRKAAFMQRPPVRGIGGRAPYAISDACARREILVPAARMAALGPGGRVEPPALTCGNEAKDVPRCSYRVVREPVLDHGHPRWPAAFRRGLRLGGRSRDQGFVGAEELECEPGGRGRPASLREVGVESPDNRLPVCLRDRGTNPDDRLRGGLLVRCAAGAEEEKERYEERY